MQKTKLGISVELMGVLVFIAALVAGYTPTLLLVGYILIAEENAWLKKAAAKAIILMVGFSLLSVAINFIPNVLNIIESFLAIFNVYFSLSAISRIFNFFYSIVNVFEIVLFALLGIKALSQGSVAIPFVDKFLDKHFN